jgi:hypothetical protein
MERMKQLDDVLRVVIAQETHEDGNPHLHVLL